MILLDIEIANDSGWMKEEDFLLYLKHFHDHAKPTAEKPAVLILDNHVSHLFVPAIDFCRDNNVTLLSIPPHSSHELQPLDRVMFGPFKTYVNRQCHAWTRECHPGKSMSIYDIPAIVGTALPKATMPANIIEAFRCTGIWPTNEDVFTDADFAPSELTERAFAPVATAPAATAPATTATVPAPVATVPAPVATAPATAATAPPLQQLSRLLQQLSPALAATVPAPVATVPVPVATVPAPVATVPAPVATALAATVPAPTATIAAPAATVPAPVATVPAPVATVPAPVATVPAPAVTIRDLVPPFAGPVSHQPQFMP